MWIQYYLSQDFKLVSINAPCIGAENVVLWVYILWNKYNWNNDLCNINTLHN